MIRILKESRTEVMINFLPVGSQAATEFYAGCALEAGVAFVNAIPVFIASNPKWAQAFTAKNIPVIGDDFKAQMGATIRTARWRDCLICVAQNLTARIS